MSQDTLRRARTWDPGPWPLPEPGHMLPSNSKIQGNYIPKIAAHVCGWGKFWAKIQRVKTQPRSWRARSENRLLEAKAGHQVYTRCSSTTRGVRKRLSHPPTLARVGARSPSPHTRNKLTTQGSSTGNWWVCSQPLLRLGPRAKPAWYQMWDPNPLDARCKTISAEMNIETGHGAVVSQVTYQNVQNLFCRRQSRNSNT